MFLAGRPLQSRPTAGVALRSGAAPVVAGLLLVLVSALPCNASPRDCVVGARRTVCLHDQKSVDRSVVSWVEDNNLPHPATVKGARSIEARPGVQSIAIEKFLPGYFVPRRSQIGIAIDPVIQQELKNAAR